MNIACRNMLHGAATQHDNNHKGVHSILAFLAEYCVRFLRVWVERYTIGKEQRNNIEQLGIFLLGKCHEVCFDKLIDLAIHYGVNIGLF